MSVVDVKLKADGRQVKESFSGVWLNGKPVKKVSGSIVYNAWSNREDELPLTVLSDGRLPSLGDRYVENGVVFRNVYFTEATPRFMGPSGSRWRWEITYSVGGEFSNAATAPEDEEDEEETTETTLLSFSASIETEDFASAVDLDGFPNANSLGEFFADPLIFKSGILNLNFSRQERRNPLSKSIAFFQAHNSAPLWGEFPAGTVKVADVSFTSTTTNFDVTYDVSYKLQYRPRGWAVEKANAGFYCVDVSAGGVVRALNADGSPTNDPVLLDLSGARLPAGSTPFFKAFRVTYPKDLSALRLPNPFEI